jgi:hypothetical protein
MSKQTSEVETLETATQETPQEPVAQAQPAKAEKGPKQVTVVYTEGFGSLVVPDYGNAWGGAAITLVAGVETKVPLELVKQLEGGVHASSVTVKE